MSDVQKVIKYLAIAFAIYLVIVIIGAIISLLGGLMLFSSDSGITENFESTKIDTSYEVKKMIIDIKAAHLVIEESEEFYIENNNSHIEVKQNKEEINIKERSFSWNKDTSSKVIIHLPSNQYFEKFYLDAGAGKIDIATLHANEIDLELGAGQVVIDNITADKEININGGAGEFIIKSGILNNLDFDMGVGHSSIEAQLLNETDIDAGVGELNIKVLGDEKEYEVDIEKGVGNVDLNGKSIGSSTKIGNGSNKLEIDGGVGRITIDFITKTSNEENNSSQEPTTFTKTYKVLNKTDYNEKDSYYLTLQLYQGEVDTVIVKNITNTIEEGHTYEFTFEKNSSKKSDNNLKSIFTNYKLVDIKETSKEGLDQIQESIN